MKKSLIALAVLAAAGAASAQSSVTLFGIVDATIQRVDNKGAGGGSVTRLHNSGESSSRLGFRGTEDLGGGMSGSFWLEAGLNYDHGPGPTPRPNKQFAATRTPPPVRRPRRGPQRRRRSWPQRPRAERHGPDLQPSCDGQSRWWHG